MKSLISSKQITKILFFLFISIGIFARVWKFGSVPGGLNQDEAFCGYEAYSILHYGTDSFGYRFPVYLSTWGSGMNALNSYLMMPFIAIFGLHDWVIRLPQLIVACLTLWVVYLIVKEIFQEQVALCALFLLSISPWHIGLSRWALESNLAPGFLMFGLYFFLLGLKKSKFFMLSALMYGLSLYCYATIWPIVPLLLLLQLLYAFSSKQLHFDRYLLFAGLILGILAFPLLLFLLINYDVIPEIRTCFLSIPRLSYMRSEDISFNQIPQNIKNLRNLLMYQTDNVLTNGTSRYGIYYRGTFSFFVLGTFHCITSAVERIRHKETAPTVFLLIQLLCGVLIGFLVVANINRVNILFIPMIIIAADGIYYLCSLIHLKYLVLPAVYYTVLFLGFEHYYFSEYSELIRENYFQGLDMAVEEAISYDTPIYFSDSLNYPRILFYAKEPAPEYTATVVYEQYPAKWLKAISFGRFSSVFDPYFPDTSITYLLAPEVPLDAYLEMGFELHSYNGYTVAHYPD